MKKIGRLVTKIVKPTKQNWNKGFSFIVYKNKGEYFIEVSEKMKGGKIHSWGKEKYPLSDMVVLIDNSEKRNKGMKITINTLPKEVWERANRELILHRLK